MSLSGKWTGVFWGTNDGVCVAELTDVAEKKVSGRLVLTESVGSFEAELAGETDGDSLNAELRNFSSKTVTALPNIGSLAGKFTEDRITGSWSTDTQTNGNFTLLKFSPPHPDQPKSNPPAFITKNVQLGCHRLDQRQLIDVATAIHDGTNVPGPGISVTWSGKTVSKAGVSELLKDGQIPAVVQDLTIAVNEPYMNAGTRSIFLTFKGKEPSSLIVNGDDAIWVEGKAAQILNLLHQYEVKTIQYVRKYGPYLNSIIFLALLALLPSIESIRH